MKINPVGQYIFLKGVISWILCHPFVSKIIELIFRNKIPHHGNRIEIPREKSNLAASLFWGIYESTEIRFIRAYLDTATDVVELGSCIGGVSCEIVRLISKNSTFVCVEANPSIIELLKRNLVFNAPTKVVRIVQGAICYEMTDTVNFFVDDSILKSHLDNKLNERFLKVPALTLSALLVQQNTGEYSLVCDIEGAEVQIFSADSVALKKCRSLVIELHSTEYCGTHYTPESIIKLIETKTLLRLEAQYGNVCAFTQ